jgi:hypothetical protein
MVTDLATLIQNTEANVYDAGIEQLVRDIGLKFWYAPFNQGEEFELATVTGIDEELLYDMGYTLGNLPGNIKNNTSEFCNKIIGKMVHSDGQLSFNDLQNQANIYLAGYQAGIGVQ